MLECLEYLIEMGYNIDREGTVTNPQGKVIKGSLVDGYVKFSVKTPSVNSYSMRVHKYQAYMKFGLEMFRKGMDVRHLDGVKTNNHWDNLQLGTRSQNMFDRPKEERESHARNRKSIPTELHEEIMKDFDSGMTRVALRKKYGIPESTMKDFVKRKLNERKHGK